MTPTVSVSDDDKAEFQEMKPAEMTQKEFFAELIDAKRRDDGEIVDVGAIVDDVQKQVAAEVELSAYRGTRDALNEVIEHDE